MKITFVFTALFLTILSTASANTITGVLLERGTRNQLTGVNVFILPHKLKATTDEAGRFVINEVPDGDFEFVVNNSGYLRLTRRGNTRTKDYPLYLEKELYSAYETTVTATADKRDVSKKSISQEMFLSAPGAQDDPLKAVQNLPGIANQSFSSAVVIQGSAPDDTRYNLNGHEIPIVFHFGGLTSVVMPQAVEAVEYLAAGYGPEYGRALGGIINLRTRPARTDRWHGMAFVDIYNSGAVIEGPIDETSSVFLSTRYSYISLLIGAAAKSVDGFDLTVAPTFTDTFIQYDKKLSSGDKLSVIAIRSEDELKFVLQDPPEGAGNTRGDFYQNTQFYRILPRWQRQLRADQSLDISAAYGENNILFEIGDLYFDLKTTSFTQRTELVTKHTALYTSYLGFDLQHTAYDVGLKLPSGNGAAAGGGDVASSNIVGGDWQNALYIRNELSLLDQRLIVAPNLRVANYTATEETHLMPRLSAVYKISDSLSATMATGLYYQAPQNGEAQMDVGNPQLKSEQAIHFALGAEKDFRDGSSSGFLLNMEVFYKDLQNLIISTSDTNSRGKPLFYSNEGNGNIIGQQTQLKWNWHDLSIVGAYTYLRSLRSEPELGEFPSEYDQTHNLNLIASYKYYRWLFSSRLRYVTGRPYTPVEGAIYDSDADSFTRINGEFFSKRYDNFFQLDLRFDRKWIYDTWILSAYLDIQNLTNRGNVEAISYNYDYSKSQKIVGLPILPIIGVKGEF